MATLENTAHTRENYNINDWIGPRLEKLAKFALPVGIVGAVMWLIGLFIAPQVAFQSYLFAYMFWFGLTLGSLAWLMGHHVVGGGWGFIFRRPLEAATRTLPIVACMFGPVLAMMWLSSLGGHTGIYEWADPKIVAADKVLTAKSAYLNPWGFTIRAVICFAIWFVLAHFMNKWSKAEDASDDPHVRQNLGTLSTVGLILYTLTLTFASIDWVMSLEPHWFSSLFGIVILVGQGQSVLCMFVLLTKKLAGDTDLVQRIEKRYFRDIGNLMLTFTLLWGYMSFSQWVIMYSGNLEEEAGWFVHRTTWGWEWVGFGIIIAVFVIPFASLLMSITKVNLGNLAKLAAFLIVIRHIDLWFYVVPTFRQTPFTNWWPAILTDIGAPLALGGIWLWGWAAQMKKAENLVPVHDPRLDGYWPIKSQEAHSHG